MVEKVVWFECISDDLEIVGYLTIGFKDSGKARELLEKFVKAVGDVLGANECHIDKVEG